MRKVKRSDRTPLAVRQAARRKLLVDALRSGEYRQTPHWLRAGDRHCGLGVACELAIDYGVSLELHEQRERDGSAVTSFDGYEAELPPVVRAWYGFATMDGKLRKPCRHPDLRRVVADSLADANDRGYTFEHLARMIERGFVLVHTDAASAATKPTTNARPKDQDQRNDPRVLAAAHAGPDEPV